MAPQRCSARCRQQFYDFLKVSPMSRMDIGHLYNTRMKYRSAFELSTLKSFQCPRETKYAFVTTATINGDFDRSKTLETFRCLSFKCGQHTKVFPSTVPRWMHAIHFQVVGCVHLFKQLRHNLSLEICMEISESGLGRTEYVLLKKKCTCYEQ